MTDEEFYQQFETATLDAKIFSHSNHIRMAWIYLKRFDFAEGAGRFSRALKNFAVANRAPKLYNETITFAFLVLINERMKKAESLQTWDEFVEANPDLFDWKNNILKKYYREETLRSALAKKVFLFPDKF